MALAVYEAWWGHPQHINIGYSSQDPETVRKQMAAAKAMGLSGFVVDWYGYRQPFIDKSYAVLQRAAADENFKIAMMYDETDDDEGATDETIEDIKLFYKNYLAPAAAGRQAYLTYNGQPVIFIFPKGRHTDWARVQAEFRTLGKSPILISEFPPDRSTSAIDGYYAWINPGPDKWAADGSHWGRQYLVDFYKMMETQYPDKIAVGGAWAGFDDHRASWSLNRLISARCGATLADTMQIWRDNAAHYYMPYLLIATWNDFEEGTAIERGVDTCGSNKPLRIQP